MYSSFWWIVVRKSITQCNGAWRSPITDWAGGDGVGRRGWRLMVRRLLNSKGIDIIELLRTTKQYFLKLLIGNQNENCIYSL